MDVLDRFKKLLAMASSPVEEEARTASHMAVKLIIEHKLEVRLPGAAARPNMQQSADTWRDILRQAEEKAKAAAAEQMRRKAEAARGPGRWVPRADGRNVWVDEWPDKPPVQKAKVSQTRSKRFSEDPVKITLKHPGHCKECGEVITSGSEGLWMKGIGSPSHPGTSRHESPRDPGEIPRQ